MGFMMWQPTNDSVRVDVSRADVYDDRTATATPHAYMRNFVYDQPRLPIGHFIVSFSTQVTGATGRISLYDGLVEYNVSTAMGVVGLRMWASADVQMADALVLEVDSNGSGQGVSAQATASVRWVPDSAQSTWIGRDPKYVPNPPPDNRSIATAHGQLNVTSQMHLRGTAHSTAVLELRGRQDAVRVAYVTSVSSVSVDATVSDAWAIRQVNLAASVGLDSLHAAHELWWHAFWPDGGFVTYEYTVLESLYFLMQYKFGSAARRGRAFMDLNGPWLIDGTNAPDVHWDWNIQGM